MVLNIVEIQKKMDQHQRTEYQVRKTNGTICAGIFVLCLLLALASLNTIWYSITAGFFSIVFAVLLLANSKSMEKFLLEIRGVEVAETNQTE